MCSKAIGKENVRLSAAEQMHKFRGFHSLLLIPKIETHLADSTDCPFLPPIPRRPAHRSAHCWPHKWHRPTQQLGHDSPPGSPCLAPARPMERQGARSICTWPADQCQTAERNGALSAARCD